MRVTSVVSILLLSSVLDFGSAHAGPGTDAVRETSEAIRVLLAQKAEADAEQKHELCGRIANEIRLLLDAKEVGRRAIQDHLDTLSTAEVEEFQTLLAALIEHSYTRAVESQIRYEIEFLEEHGTVNRKVVTEVRTTRGGKPYTAMVTFQLHHRNAAWRAYDVVTDGASLVASYRAQFNRIIAKEGYHGLLSRMRKRSRVFQQQELCSARPSTVGHVSL